MRINIVLAYTVTGDRDDSTIKNKRTNPKRTELKNTASSQKSYYSLENQTVFGDFK